MSFVRIFGGVEVNWLKGDNKLNSPPYLPNSLKIEVELNLPPYLPNSFDMEVSLNLFCEMMPKN